MNVAELKAILASLPDDMPVFTSNDDCSAVDDTVVHIKPISIKKDLRKEAEEITAAVIIY